MDSKGRVMLPLGLRYKLDINEEDVMAVDQLEDGTILLKKVDVPIHRRIEMESTRVRIAV
jgi:bifunctional DNA-binding transcriptional regulator/antitoxin component of YhaV-PrlF toxin-antitoxin module